MKVYRYDHKDGGGPFMTADGILRSNNEVKMNNGYLSCCLSLNELNKWFYSHNGVDLTNCYINIYEIPEKELKKSASHYYFPKKYKGEKNENNNSR